MDVCAVCKVLGLRCMLFCLDLVCDCFVLSRQQFSVGMVVHISWSHTCLCVDVMVISSA